MKTTVRSAPDGSNNHTMSNNRLQAKETFSVNLELYKQKMEMFTIHISLSDHRQLATFYTNKLLSAVGLIPKDY